MGGLEGNTQTKEDQRKREPFRQVLAEAVEICESRDIPYLVGGSLASAYWGRPTALGDIDLFIDPSDAKSLLEAFAQAGYETEIAEEQWLYKAKKDRVLVDLIFEMSGPMYLEPQMIERGVYVEQEGTKFRLMSAEDYVVSQAMALKEDTPDYWFNALGVIGRSEIDWAYLAEVGMRGPRMVLALLIFAQASDLPVPYHAIRKLFHKTYEG